MAKQERLSIFLHKEAETLSLITQEYQGFAGIIISGHEALTLPQHRVQHLIRASAHFNHKTDCQINLAQQPFPKEYFDVVILHHLFDEGNNIETLLKEAKRILRNDGILLISGFERMRICARLMQKRFTKAACTKRIHYSILDIQAKLTELQFKMNTYHFDFCRNKTLEKYLQHIVPFLGIGFWIKAQKEIYPLTPLVANAWELDSVLTPINPHPEYLTPQKHEQHQ